MEQRESPYSELYVRLAQLSSVSLPLCGFERATEDVWLLLYTEQPNDDDDCTSGSAGTMNYYLLCKDVEIMIR